MKPKALLWAALLACAVPFHALAAADRPGMGSSDAPLQGAPFSLPAGVELAGPIMGYSLFVPDSCRPKDDEEGEESEPVGAGDLVRVCIPLRNNTDRQPFPQPVPVWVEFPPGFSVVSESLGTQNGVLVKKQRVLVRPGEVKYLPMYMLCLNSTRSGSSPYDSFKLGPVIDYPDFKALYKRLENIDLVPEGHALLQSVVWSLSEGKAPSPEELSAIDAL